MFITVADRKITNPVYVILMSAFEYLKLLVVLSDEPFKILFARKYVPAMQNVAESFNTVKRGIFQVRLAMKGLSSMASKYKSPITVVMQSIKPISTSMNIGNMLTFRGYIMPSPFSFLPLCIGWYFFLRMIFPNSIYS